MKKTDIRLGKRYAAALFEVCQAGDLDAMREALQTFAEIWRTDTTLQTTLLNPSLLLSQRMAGLRSIAELIKPGDKLFSNILATLLRNKRMDGIDGISRMFSTMVDAMRRHLSLEVISAFELSQSEKDDVHSRIRSACGAEASLNWRVDRTLMGGLIIRAGDRMVDGSIRGSLEKLRADFLA